MKKKNLSPLELDKETIAKLDEKQIDAIVGGKKGADDADESNNCTRNTCRGGTSCNASELEEAN